MDRRAWCHGHRRRQTGPAREVLRQIDHRRRAGDRVPRVRVGVRAPAAHAAEFFAGQRGAEHVVAHQMIGRRVEHGVLLEPQVAQDLHRPLVGDVGTRRVGQPPVFRDQHVADAVGREQGRRTGACGAAAHNEHVGFDHGRFGVRFESTHFARSGTHRCHHVTVRHSSCRCQIMRNVWIQDLTPFISRSCAGVPVVLLADALDQLDIGLQRPIEVHLPRLRIGLRDRRSSLRC